MAITRTRAGHQRNAAGTARPGIAGGEAPQLTALDALAMQMFTTVSGLTNEITDGTTQTIQSDNDAFTLDEIETGYGTTQAQTFTLTEMKDQTGNAPYIKALNRSLPYSLVVPEGRDRRLSDIYSGSSWELVDRFYVQGRAQDDDSNPSDGDVGNANTMSITCRTHGRNIHNIRQLNLTDIGGATAGMVGAAFAEQRSGAGGGIGRTWVAVEKGLAAVKPKFHIRDEYQQWSNVAFGANGNTPRGAGIAGSYAVTANGASIEAVNLDDTSSIITTLQPGVDAANSPFTGLYVHSPTEIFAFTGKAAGNANTQVAEAVKITNPISAGTQIADLRLTGVGSGSAGTGSQWNAMHGRGSQIIIVGQEGGTTNAEWTPAAKISEDRGVSWKDLTIPKLNTDETPDDNTGHATQTTITSVYIAGKDIFWFGTAAGVVYWTYNGGTTWQTATIEGSTPTYIYQIAFVEPRGAGAEDPASRAGFIFGKTSSGLFIARTLDGGNRWVSGSAFKNLVSQTSITGTHWGQCAVAGPQSLLAVGLATGASFGADATTDVFMLQELE